MLYKEEAACTVHESVQQARAKSDPRQGVQPRKAILGDTAQGVPPWKALPSDPPI